MHSLEQIRFDDAVLDVDHADEAQDGALGPGLVAQLVELRVELAEAVDELGAGGDGLEGLGDEGARRDGEVALWQGGLERWYGACEDGELTRDVRAVQVVRRMRFLA